MSRASRFAIAALFIASTFAPAALAQVNFEQVASVERVTLRVSYSDLDMASSAGGKVLLRRIKAAARKVCGYATPRLVPTPRAVEICSRRTVAATVHDLNIEALSLAWKGNR